MKRAWIGPALLLCILCGCHRQPAPETVPPATRPAATQPATLPPETLPPETLPPEPLTLDREPGHFDTWEDLFLLSGAADPRYPPALNGQPLELTSEGAFSLSVPLEVGENTLQLTYLDQTVTFTVTRRYTTVRYLHTEGGEYCSGATIRAEIIARQDSVVELSFNGQQVTLSPSDDQLGFAVPQGFCRYTHRFDPLPSRQEDRDLGPMTYTVTCHGIREEYATGPILLRGAVEMRRSDPEATPTGYRDVGSGYIVEIVDVNAETFDGRTLDDKSNPTMNYLPQGTVDYGTQGVYYNESANRYYYLLRCGVRVYRRNDNRPLGTVPVVDCYNGLLPDHNELSVARFRVDGHHTELALDCLWKAPFFFDQEAQAYYTQDWHRFILDEYTATYVDITFCYATVLENLPQIPEDHPLFSRAELIQNEADCTLRLHLKEPGGFYGWNAYYNEDGQLCFRFLNPVAVTPADNFYGADLTGLTVMIDVGHGGQDPGAYYPDSAGLYWKESERNLALAQALAGELEGVGARVLLNRTDEDYTLTRAERIAFLMEQEPDFCICIHHNADRQSGMRGIESWYFTPFSLDAAQSVCQAHADGSLYPNSRLSWHYYYVARQTVCPIVLAENGYMSNKKEMDLISDPERLLLRAQALARGIVNYYLAESQ